MPEALVTLGIYWDKLIAQFICFAIVFFVLQRFAYKPVLDILEKRRKKIADALIDAEEMKKLLASADLQRQDMLAKAHQESARIIAETQKAATNLTEKKMQEAVATAEQIVQKAQQAMALERDKMVGEVKKELVQLVITTTAKVTGKILTQEDQNRLNQETLVALKS